MEKDLIKDNSSEILEVLKNDGSYFIYPVKRNNKTIYNLTEEKMNKIFRMTDTPNIKLTYYPDYEGESLLLIDKINGSEEFNDKFDSLVQKLSNMVTVNVEDWKEPVFTEEQEQILDDMVSENIGR